MLELYLQSVISRQKAAKMLAWCNNTGPAFIVGFVGSSLWGSPLIGWVLYVCHFLSAAAVGLFSEGFRRIADTSCGVTQSEMTQGVFRAAYMDAPFAVRLAVQSGLMGFGGLSVYFQVKSVTTLPTKAYLCGKVSQGVIAAALAWIAAQFLPCSETVMLFAPVGGQLGLAASAVLILLYTFMLTYCQFYGFHIYCLKQPVLMLGEWIYVNCKRF